MAGIVDIVGVAGSIERKVLAAVGLQFCASVALAVVAVLFSGVTQFVLTGRLLAGAVVAFLNTVFITREDLVEPLVTLAERADRVAAGEVESVGRRTDDLEALLDQFEVDDGAAAGRRSAGAETEVSATGHG